jgi:hypothetical protein
MILVASVLLLIVVFLAIYNLDSLLGGLDFTTKNATISKIVEIIKYNRLEKGLFYDLGSCRGAFAIRLSKELPNLQIHGMDDNLFRVVFAKARSIFKKNLVFKKGNIFQEDLSSADIIYLYLPQDMMADLQDKMQRELKPNALVITNKISFPSWEPIESFNAQDPGPFLEKIFVYKKLRNLC